MRKPILLFAVAIMAVGLMVGVLTGATYVDGGGTIGDTPSSGQGPGDPPGDSDIHDDPNPDNAPAITVRDLPSCDNIELPRYSGSLPTAPPTYGTPNQPGNILCGLTPTQVDTPRPGPAHAPQKPDSYIDTDLNHSDVGRTWRSYSHWIPDTA